MFIDYIFGLLIPGLMLLVAVNLDQAPLGLGAAVAVALIYSGLNSRN